MQQVGVSLTQVCMPGLVSSLHMLKSWALVRCGCRRPLNWKPGKHVYSLFLKPRITHSCMSLMSETNAGEDPL